MIHFAGTIFRFKEPLKRDRNPETCDRQIPGFCLSKSLEIAALSHKLILFIGVITEFFHDEIEVFVAASGKIDED